MGMGSSKITREAVLVVSHGNRKHKLDAHQKRFTIKILKVQIFPQLLLKGVHTRTPPLSQGTTWDTNQLRRNHVGQFVLPPLDSYTSSCMLMCLRGEKWLRSPASVELWALRRLGVCNDPVPQNTSATGQQANDI